MVKKIISNLKGKEQDKIINKEYYEKIKDLKVISEITNKERIKYDKINNLIPNEENFQDEGLVVSLEGKKNRTEYKTIGPFDLRYESKKLDNKNLKRKIKNIDKINGSDNIFKHKLISNKKYIIIIIFIIMINLLIKKSICIKLVPFEYHFSNITLRIKGIGNKYILGLYAKDNFPNIININGEKQDIINYYYNFNQTDNFVELVWNNNINNCYFMFGRCYDITEIDLSYFDTSNVEDMSYMFYYCNSLTSLNLSSFDTSLVKNMDRMFFNCLSLDYLDLSSFNTSQVTTMSCLFYNCILLISLNITNFNTSQVKDMSFMFYECSSLTYLDISNFNTSKVKTLGCLFYNCISLSYIELSSFDTSQVIEMNHMFYNCTSLKSLDLSNFNTSKVTTMYSLFAICSSLSSLNLMNFETSQVTVMLAMFYGCSSLTSLDLSNFNTSQMIDMSYMFSECSSLSSLNLSNFEISKITKINNMFDGCTNLEYINIMNFNEYNIQYCFNIFDGIVNNAVICINEDNNILLQQIYDISCVTLYCLDDWKLKQKKIINETGKCIDSCTNDTFYKYEYNGKCYENCSHGFLNNEDNNSINECKCELEKCLTCPQIALNNNLCTKCNHGYYPMENDSLNFGEYFNCYREPEGYYLDNNSLIFKKCYNKCKKCNKSGNEIINNCDECIDKYIFINDSLAFSNNCYKQCKYYYYFNETKQYTCTESNKCPEQYSILINQKNKCIDECKNDDKYKYYYNNECIEKCPSNTKIDERTNECLEFFTQDQIEFNNISYNDLSNITNQIIQNGNGNIFIDNLTNFDNILNNIILSSYSPEGKNSIIIQRSDNVIYHVTNSKNELELLKNKNVNSNISIIDLGECENILREKYHINENDSLIFIKNEIISSKASEKNINFDVYEPYNKTKLNLSLCDGTPINIFVPMELNEENKKLYEQMKELGYDMFNIEDPFYQDICTPFDY